MAYCAQADLDRAAGGSERLIALADHDGDGSVDAAVITDAIAWADGIIDSALHRRFATPVDPVPSSIERASAEIATYWLKSKRNAVDEHAQRVHDFYVDPDDGWLARIATGRLDPGIDPVPAKSVTVAAQAGDRSAVDDAVTRESLERFL